MSEYLPKKCGHVAIIGRPNMGKSTLLNSLLGEKLSITSRKPQTTRHRILGIKTTDTVQAIYVDTPGLHQKEKRAMNRYMNRAAINALQEVDVILFLLDREHWTAEDVWIAKHLKEIKKPVIVVINKIDKLDKKERLLPCMAALQNALNCHSIIPVSAKKGRGIQQLEKIVHKLLPQDEFMFPEEQFTDRSQRFLAAEILREKLMRNLGQELPYSLTVEIGTFEYVQEIKTHINIDALILVETQGQKQIIIGNQGEKLKAIATKARVDMEDLFQEKVYLQVWVKIRQGWADDERALRSLGFDDA